MSYNRENSQFVTSEYWDNVLQVSDEDRATFVGQSGVDKNGWYFMYWQKSGKVYYTCQNINPFSEMVDHSTYPISEEVFQGFLALERGELQVGGPAPALPEEGHERVSV